MQKKIHPPFRPVKMQIMETAIAVAHARVQV